MEPPAAVVPPPPPAAAVLLGDRLQLASHYVGLLATTGIKHGLVGPREAPRLWDRHVLNCAVVSDLIVERGSAQPVIDVGSGAGLPGLVLAILRPDLHVHLVEPLARRTAWLADTVTELELSNVTIHTARAESLWGVLRAPSITARAVTGIVRLAEWTLPLVEAPGQVLALKGSRGPGELAAAESALRQLGVARSEALTVGQGVVAEPTTVLRLILDRPVDLRRHGAHGTTSAGSARRRRHRPRPPRR